MAKFFSLEKTDDRIHTWISFQSHYVAGIRKFFHILHTGVNITKNGISVNHPQQSCIISFMKVQLYIHTYI